MKKDTFGFLLVALFVVPLGMGLWLGVLVDFERVCVSDGECGDLGVCVQGACMVKRRCAWARAHQTDCGVGYECDFQKGYCYRDQSRYRGLIHGHPGYYSYRAERRGLRGQKLRFTVLRHGRRRVVLYRTRGGRGFRGGGLGFGK